MSATALSMKSDASVLEALDRAATQKVSAEDLREQRVSFVFGSVSADSAITREQVKRVIDQQDLAEA